MSKSAEHVWDTAFAAYLATHMANGVRVRDNLDGARAAADVALDMWREAMRRRDARVLEERE